MTILKNGDAAISFRSPTNHSEIQLGMSESGVPRLCLYDTDGSLKALLSILPKDGACLRLIHNDGKPRAWLSLADSGEPAMGICDRNAQSGIVFQLSKNNKPALILRNEGIMRGIFCVSDIGPSINLLDEYGKIRTVLGKTSLNSSKNSEKMSVSALTFFDGSGKLIYKLP